jgi:hypothetical protein
VLSRSQTTDTTTTAHPITFQSRIDHVSTTDTAVLDSTSTTTPAAPGGGICDAGAFQVADKLKSLCLHVKGSGANGAFVLAAAKRPVITMQCITGSTNQLFTWTPSAAGGQLIHSASGLAVGIPSADVYDGAVVTVITPADTPEQTWAWADATTGGGILASVADPRFEITDSKVNAGSSIGLPVHMWHLKASLPSGSPNANWAADCA